MKNEGKNNIKGWQKQKKEEKQKKMNGSSKERKVCKNKVKRLDESLKWLLNFFFLFLGVRLFLFSFLVVVKPWEKE